MAAAGALYHLSLFSSKNRNDTIYNKDNTAKKRYNMYIMDEQDGFIRFVFSQISCNP